MKRQANHKLLIFAITSIGCLQIHAQQRSLVWSDEFETPVLNETYWTHSIGYGAGNDGWGNQELQNYIPENISFQDGCLVITAKKTGEDKKRGDYTSARISTKNKQAFLYGRIEARMKLPLGTGVWPAFWMLGASGHWPDCGEIDIMEYVGYEPGIIHSALHTRSSHGNTVNKDKIPIEGNEGDFHIYGINWTKDRIEFYIDNPDTPFYTYQPAIKNPQTWPFDQPHYILFNLAIGGLWGGKNGIDNTIFPQQFWVDWVRVYSE